MFKKTILITVITIGTLAGGVLDAAIPNFELWNKTQHKIDAEVVYNGRMQKTHTIRPNERFHLYDVDMRRKMLVTINDTERYYIDSCEEHSNCHRTVYLSYDHTGLRPQKGKWRGILGITMSGYDNTKNISEDKIHGIQIIEE